MTHIPVRECICCRTKAAKQEFVRIAKVDSSFLIDDTGKRGGRGAYICRTCVLDPMFFKKRPLDRAFRQKVSDEVYEALFAYANEHAAQDSE